MLMWQTVRRVFDVDDMDREVIVAAFREAGHRDILPEEPTGDYIETARGNAPVWSRAWETLAGTHGSHGRETVWEFDRDRVAVLD